MTPERVAELAREANGGSRVNNDLMPWLQRFAALIEQEIRADDARICRHLGRDGQTFARGAEARHAAAMDAYHFCAAAIERAAKGAGT